MLDASLLFISHIFGPDDGDLSHYIDTEHTSVTDFSGPDNVLYVGSSEDDNVNGATEASNAIENDTFNVTNENNDTEHNSSENGNGNGATEATNVINNDTFNVIIENNASSEGSFGQVEPENSSSKFPFVNYILTMLYSHIIFLFLRRN